MERKPYYILRIFCSNFILHEGIARDVYPHSGNGIQLYLTESEAQKYDNERVIEILKPYYEIIKKRYMYIPSELILYAISEVLYA